MKKRLKLLFDRSKITTYTNKLRLNYIIVDREGDDVYSLHRTCPGPMLRLQGILHSNLN